MTTEGPCRINTILYNNLYVSYVLQQHLGLWPVGVEDVGVVCAVHHLAAGLLVFVTAAAVGAVGFGSMPISGHPVACVAHNASLFVCYWIEGKRGQLLICMGTNHLSL